MRLSKADWKDGKVQMEMTSPEDPWVLSQVIEPGDLLTARTMRKIKMGGEEDRTSNVEKKPVRLTILTTKVQLAPERDALRVSGTVTQGPEDIPLGSYHTITLSIRTQFTLQKTEWLSFQKDKIIESTKDKRNAILLCIHDREEAVLAQSGPDAYKVLAHLHGQVQKKYADQNTTNFYDEIIKVLEEYDKRKNPSHIILASPAFWKEDLLKQLSNADLKKKIVQATCSSVSENAINEVLARPETRTALDADRIAQESKAVEELLSAIGSDKPATYGPDHVKEAAEAGAVATLLISDHLLAKYKDEGDFPFIEGVMKATERAKGKILVIGSSHEAGKRLDGIGGIGAILRFPLS